MDSPYSHVVVQLIEWERKKGCCVLFSGLLVWTGTVGSTSHLFSSSFLFFSSSFFVSVQQPYKSSGKQLLLASKHTQASNQSIGFSSRKNLQSFSLSYNFPSSLCYFFLVSVKKKSRKNTFVLRSSYPFSIFSFAYFFFAHTRTHIQTLLRLLPPPQTLFLLSSVVFFSFFLCQSLLAMTSCHWINNLLFFYFLSLLPSLPPLLPFSLCSSLFFLFFVILLSVFTLSLASFFLFCFSIPVSCPSSLLFTQPYFPYSLSLSFTSLSSHPPIRIHPAHSICILTLTCNLNT